MMMTNEVRREIARKVKEKRELTRKKREEEKDKIHMDEVSAQVKVWRREKYERELALCGAGVITFSDEQVEHYKEWLERNPEEVVVNG